jgi:drug/metabolite transporter (DMT)-like permease
MGIERMVLLALVFIIVAAFLHAAWNVLAKVSKDMLALMWWATLLATVGYGVWLLSGSGIYLDPASWVPFLVSAFAETGYFVTLVRGYSQGDLSLVYPISRGSAPIFATIWGAVLLGEQLPWFGYLGILLMVTGVYVASVPVNPSGIKFHPSVIISSFRNRAAGWALASAIFISIFSLSDKVAVSATPPLIYNWWVFAGNTVLWMIPTWGRTRFKTNFDELRSNWRGVIATGFMMVSAYGAALAALALTSASYVVAGRGLSVVIGALFGSVLLKESFGASRITGAALMVAGLALIAFT